MPVTHTFAPAQEQCFQEIERLTNSHILRGSDALCRMLRYLAEHSLAQPPSAVKEYRIATEVFGRPTDFDPQVDSTIRVQASRLRGKLAEYYSSEGAEDPITVELPRGSYALQFHPRLLANGRAQALAIAEPKPKVSAIPAHGGSAWKIAVFALVMLLAAAGIIIAELASRTEPTRVAASAQSAPAAFQTFWSPFLGGPDEPWVVFSNAAFIGRPETGMRYFNPQRDPRGEIWDHYTGVGEVLSVHQLDQVFGNLHQPLRVKRGSLFSLDDAKNNNLIFVGSPSENLTLMDIPGSEEFVFRRMDAGPRKGDLAVENVHPGPGEHKDYLGSPSGYRMTEDYAIVAFMPGLNPARSLMILAGTTTFGTQAAVEFVCRQNSVEELLSRLGISKPEEMPPFEALLHTKITRGVPVETELVAIRKRKQ